jgi:Rrf2 family nitric oxide-sensitive transcriptional repressor
MRLAEYTDYTLRVLLYCGSNPDRLVTITEIATSHAISRSHLTKIVNDLGHQGLLETVRGRSGGIRLAKAPRDIRIGDVVRAAETDFRLVECFDAASNACTITAACRVKKLLGSALAAYFRELDAATLADMLGPAPHGPRLGTGMVIPIRAAAAEGAKRKPRRAS